MSTLEVIAEGGEVEYKFWTTGTVSANNDLNPKDTIKPEQGYVHGSCNGWHDSFDFDGEPMDFVVEDGYENMTIKVDGRKLLPAHLKMNTIEVESADGNLTAYGLSSSGKMIRRGKAELNDVRNDDNEFMGQARGGSDKFAYAGTLTGVWANRDITVTVNGIERTVEGNPPSGSQNAIDGL